MASGTIEEVRNVVEAPSTMKWYMCVEWRWTVQYVSDELGALWDSNIAILNVGGK